MFVIETWQFVTEAFVPCRAFGTFGTLAEAVSAMRREIRASGKDMSRFRVAAAA